MNDNYKKGASYVHYVLHPSYVLRQWRTVSELVNWVTGEEYELTQAQVQEIIPFTDPRGAPVSDFGPDGARTLARELLDDEAMIPATEAKPNKPRTCELNRPLERVHWELTGLCNLSCEHCYNADYNRADADWLNASKAEKTVQEMDSLNVVRVQISGGEPLLSPHLELVLNQLASHRLHVDGVFTNGLKLDQEWARRLKNYPWEYEVIVSLDGLAKGHDQLRGKGSYASAWQAVELMAGENPAVTINTMVLSSNQSEITELMKRITEIPNLKRWRLGVPNIQGRFRDSHLHLAVSFPELREVYANVLREYLDGGHVARFALELGDFFHSDLLEEGFVEYQSSDSPCSYAAGLMTLKPDGQLQLCPSLDDLSFGHAKDGLFDAWEAAWNHSLKTFRVNDLSGCQSCRYLSLCGGGCRANARDLSGNLWGRDPRACFAMEWYEENLTLLPESAQDSFRSLLRIGGDHPYRDVSIGDRNA